ncbi:MAG: methionine synthase [Clostridium sp.]|uniref:vitamin B12 dependent-methionine synthase activation domain-containing protein n=1 Tax=Clostridium sp. DSM 8431 TaxID=1761781 RepID=UPI0008E7A89E|nr:vitamin B12 dependent-methionine synthase activation domain-containing protein [Clostridium sp. DSM 8431]MCR4943012.1 methionine synthase [Clostridium sp.]SFU67953.1 Vitamin B12 dependent methionine synthase, activation domain [Clostridium sp. DSM 8431]
MENNKTFESLEIPKDEVLRYLGYKAQKQSIDKSLDELIDSIIEESKELIEPKFVYSKYSIEHKEDGVYFNGTKLILTGDDIKKHLENSKECVLMAVTVGNRIEQRIKLYQKISLTKALILDSCATTAVEEICDMIEEKVKNEAAKDNFGITFRYSPGYGDLPLDVQKDLIDTLNAQRRIGLTVSSHFLLFPRKSVTAIIGFIPKDKEEKRRGCEVCKNYESCSFRREGLVCGS